MDTSETYIKMCEKAEEIQAKRIIGEPYEEGDCWAYLLKRSKRKYDMWIKSWVGLEHSDEYGIEIRKSNHIWLPRQDDLQKMVSIKDSYSLTSPPHKLVQAFRNFCLKTYGYSWGDVTEESEETKMLTSMNQLWLAFVMKELHSKEWANSEWVVLGGE